MTGQTVSDEQLVVPVLTLLAYVDGRLHWVAPCSDGQRTYTVDDALRSLETTGSLPNRSPNDLSSDDRAAPSAIE